MNEIIAPFTYAGLPAPVATELQAVTARIKDRLTRQVSDIIETGRDLLDVKSKLEHGQFESWLSFSFNMTVRTAQKYMRAAEWMADKSELSSYLTPSTIYLLSAPSTPESAQRQVLDDIEAGRPIDHREVREVVEEAKDEERKEEIAGTAALMTRALGGRWHGSYGTARCPAHDDRERVNLIADASLHRTAGSSGNRAITRDSTA